MKNGNKEAVVKNYAKVKKHEKAEKKSGHEKMEKMMVKAKHMKPVGKKKLKGK